VDCSWSHGFSPALHALTGRRCVDGRCAFLTWFVFRCILRPTASLRHCGECWPIPIFHLVHWACWRAARAGLRGRGADRPFAPLPDFMAGLPLADCAAAGVLAATDFLAGRPALCVRPRPRRAAGASGGIGSQSAAARAPPRWRSVPPPCPAPDDSEQGEHQHRPATTAARGGRRENPSPRGPPAAAPVPRAAALP